MSKLFEMTVSINDGDMLISLLIVVALLCISIAHRAIRPVIKSSTESGGTRVGVFLWTLLIATALLFAIFLMVTFSVTFN